MKWRSRKGDDTQEIPAQGATFALYALDPLTEGLTLTHHLQAAKRRRKGAKMALIDYEHRGDYMIPCIVLDEPPRELTEPITKYGAMRRAYLRNHRAITYSRLLLTERLFPHLRETQQIAHERLDAIMSDILRFRPAPDKAADPMGWSTHMTEVHRTAEKMMLDEVIYV